MHYTTFGRRCGLRVSQYALGTGNFGTGWGAGAEPDEARQIFEQFLEAGGNFIDTADVYQFGESEQLVGEFIANRRDDVVLASKFSRGATGQPSLSRTGNSRKTMRSSVEASLRRLGTDHLDLLWVHFPDDLTPIEEILRGLDDLVSQGKILHGALSNFPAWRISRAVTIADLANWAPIIGVQVEYSLVQRTADRELLPMADALGLGTALWSPLGGGLLTGKYRDSDAGRLTDLKMLVHTESTTTKTAIVDAVIAIADEVGATPAQVSIAWLNELAARAATAYVPVIGPRNTAQLDDYLAALDVHLTGDQFDRLASVSAVELGVPHESVLNARNGLQGGDSSLMRSPVIPVS